MKNDPANAHIPLRDCLGWSKWEAMKDIESPEQRAELVANLFALSSRKYQQHVWVEGHSWGAVVHDEFNYAVHFFFDDSTLQRNPYDNIGWMLLDKAEADLVTAVIEAIDAVLVKHGNGLSDAEYIATPEWVAVVEAARAALAVIPDSEKAPLFSASHDDEPLMTPVKYPDMRLELLGSLRGLSNPEYQQRVWVEHQAWGSVEYDTFDNAVHFLFDDTALSKNAHAYIGDILLNTSEAERVATLIATLESIFAKHGVGLTDAQYMALPEWISVIESARAALAVIPKSEWAHL